MVPARENPFASHRVLRERYRLDGAGWAVLHSRLRTLGGRGAVVGPHGSGKTTLLEDFAEHLSRSGRRVTFVRLNAEVAELPAALRSGALAQLGPNDTLLLDGAEQLSWWRWRCVRHHTRTLGGLIITTHQPGRLPTLWRCATSPELLRELVQALGSAIDETTALALYARHHGNLRSALRELYDCHAEQVI